MAQSTGQISVTEGTHLSQRGSGNALSGGEGEKDLCSESGSPMWQIQDVTIQRILQLLVTPGYDDSDGVPTGFVMRTTVLLGPGTVVLGATSRLDSSVEP